MYTVTVKNEAHLDALEAYHYYEKKQVGLGEQFLLELADRYHDLSIHPYNYSFVEGDKGETFRDVRLIHFPYLVVYEIDENKVIVFAIFNAHQHPGKKIRK